MRMRESSVHIAHGDRPPSLRVRGNYGVAARPESTLAIVL
jgi:hypothetical protein